MNITKLLCVAAAGLVLSAATLTATEASSQATSCWPQWRGPLASGVAPQADPPLEWSENKNVKWKVRLPGSGTSTPVVWGDRVFILTAVSSGKKAEGRSRYWKGRPRNYRARNQALFRADTFFTEIEPGKTPPGC